MLFCSLGPYITSFLELFFPSCTHGPPFQFIQAPMQLSLSKSLKLNTLLKIVPLLFLKINFRTHSFDLISFIVCFIPPEWSCLLGQALCPFYSAPYSSIVEQPGPCNNELLLFLLFNEKPPAYEDIHPFTGKVFSVFLLCVTLHGSLDYVLNLYTKHHNCTASVHWWIVTTTSVLQQNTFWTWINHHILAKVSWKCQSTSW